MLLEFAYSLFTAAGMEGCNGDANNSGYALEI